MVKNLPSMFETLSLIPSTGKKKKKKSYSGNMAIRQGRLLKITRDKEAITIRIKGSVHQEDMRHVKCVTKCKICETKTDRTESRN